MTIEINKPGHAHSDEAASLERTNAMTDTQGIHPDFAAIDQFAKTTKQKLPVGVSLIGEALAIRRRNNPGQEVFSVDDMPESIEPAPADPRGITRKILGRVATSDDATMKATRAHDMPEGTVSRRSEIALDRFRRNGNQPGTRQHFGQPVKPESVVLNGVNKIADKLRRPIPT